MSYLEASDHPELFVAHGFEEHLVDLGEVGPRTGEEKATDEAGGSGYADLPPGFVALTWHFRLPACCRHLPLHRVRIRAGALGAASVGEVANAGISGTQGRT
jgi:hypothetical protein